MVLALCKDYQVKYPIFIDTEGAGGDGRADKLTPDKRTAVCLAFCQTIKNAGYDAGIYASKNWFNNNIKTSILPDDIFIWLAEYTDEVSYTGKYHIWQYTSSGRVNGIEGRVDLNLSFVEPMEKKNNSLKDNNSGEDNTKNAGQNEKTSEDTKNKVTTSDDNRAEDPKAIKKED